MFCAEMLPGPPIDISPTWCAATGEAGCRAVAHLRDRQLVAVQLIEAPDLGRPLIMCRGGAIGILSIEAVEAIETRHGRATQPATQRNPI